MAVPSVDGGRSLETRSGRQPILWLQVDPDTFRDGPLAWLDAPPISPDIRLGGELADQIDAHAVNGLPGPAILDLQAQCDPELDRARAASTS